MGWVASLSSVHIYAAVIVLILLRVILAAIKNPALKPITEIVESALIAIVLVFLLIRPFVVQAFYIPSESMLPTLRVNDRILVNKFIYRFREPRYGEVVVFKAPPAAMVGKREQDYIKRLIGKEGDVIEVRDGAVYRNGVRLKEPYMDEPQIEYDMQPQEIPKGMVFVMGDNRNNSNDSHAWGPLERRRILGKAFVVFWPFKRIGFIH